MPAPKLSRPDPGSNGAKGGFDMRRGKLARLLTNLLSAPSLAALCLFAVAFRIGPGPHLGWLLGEFGALVLLPGLTLAEAPWWPRTIGRRARRLISFGGSLAGYTTGLLAAWLGGAPPLLLATALAYFLSTVILALVNLFYKASGHGCGVAGPLTAFFFLFHWLALPGLLLFPAVAWARRQLGAHTLPQVVVGAAISIAATAVAFSIVI